MSLINKNYKTVEEGTETLKDGVKIRNQIVSELNWYIADNKCLELAQKLINDGANKNEIALIGDWDLEDLKGV